MEEKLKDAIIHMLEGITDIDRLERIYYFVQYIYIQK